MLESGLFLPPTYLQCKRTFNLDDYGKKGSITYRLAASAAGPLKRWVMGFISNRGSLLHASPLISASSCSSQKRMSRSRYILVAIASCSWAFSPSLVRR